MAHAFEFEKQQEGEPFSKTIIIVEDDPSNAEVLSMLLHEEKQYQTICFRTGGEVLAKADIIKSLHPALFLLDYQLPHMTALDLYEQFHTIEGLASVPILILSGTSISDTEKDRITQLGLILIPKPYDVDDLLSVIKQMVG